MAVTSALAAGLVGAAVSGAVTPLAGRVALRAGIVDRPGPLKVHTEAIPYLGGAAVFFGVVVAEVTAGSERRLGLLLPPALALALGAADDARSLGAATRLVAALGIGAVVAVVVPTRLPEPVGRGAVTAVTVLLINAVNLVDGLDGLAAGTALAGAIGFVAILAGSQRVLAASLAGALCGFLPHNWPRARIYLGDGGAYAMGTSLAVLLASCWQRDVPVSNGVAASLLVAYPVCEVAAAIIRRRRGRLPFSAGDRRHVYDRLVAKGWSVRRAAAGCAGAQGALAALAVASADMPVGAVVGVAVTVGALLLAGSAAVGALSAEPGHLH